MCAMSTADAPARAAGTRDADRDAVIHTEDLTKVYPGTDFAAVDRLNLDVKAGEIFGLLGPNGAGKTTTAGMLTTRVVPTSGRAFLGGIDVAGHPALAKQLSGIVSQQNTLDRQLTVWENLYFQTVSWRSRVFCWDTIPLSCLASAGWAATSIPPRNARPDVGTTRVVSIPAVVVLPAPLGPSRPKISPAFTSRLSRSTAAKSVPG